MPEILERLLQQGRFEFSIGGQQLLTLAREEVSHVALQNRPLYEALAFVALAGLSALFVHHLAPRLALAVLALLAIGACLLRRRFALLLTLQSGRRVALHLGVAKRGSLAALERGLRWLERQGSAGDVLEAGRLVHVPVGELLDALARLPAPERPAPPPVAELTALLVLLPGPSRLPSTDGALSLHALRP